MKNKLSAVLMVLFVISCNVKYDELKSLIEISQIKQISGIWQPDMGNNRDQLKIKDDGSFSIKLNYCSGDYVADGYCKIMKGKLFLYRTGSKTVSNEIKLKWPVIILALNDQDQLIYINDVSVIMDGEELRYCSPNKGTVLMRKEAMINEARGVFIDPLNIGFELEYNEETIRNIYGEPDSIDIFSENSKKLYYLNGLEFIIYNQLVKEISVDSDNIILNKSFKVGSDKPHPVEILGFENVEYKPLAEIYRYKKYTLIFYYSDDYQLERILWQRD